MQHPSLRFHADAFGRKRQSKQAAFASECCTRAERNFELQLLVEKEERGVMRHLHSGLMEAQQNVQREVSIKLGMEMRRTDREMRVMNREMPMERVREPGIDTDIWLTFSANLQRDPTLRQNAKFQRSTGRPGI